MLLTEVNYIMIFYLLLHRLVFVTLIRKQQGNIFGRWEKSIFCWESWSPFYR
jgi:hypothetical protein